jgi:hypothetical protein
MKVETAQPEINWHRVIDLNIIALIMEKVAATCRQTCRLATRRRYSISMPGDIKAR